MEKKEFLEHIQTFLETQQIDKAKEFFTEAQADLPKIRFASVLDILFNIHELELQNNETSFFNGKSTVSQLEECFDTLKFYLRRLDFDIPSIDSEFLAFIETYNISSSSIYIITKTATLHPVKVLNKAAMIFSEYDYLLLAVKLLTYAYQDSKDDTTLFNYSLVLWKCGIFEKAELVLNQISTINEDVLLLKKLIEEKVKYNG